MASNLSCYDQCHYCHTHIARKAELIVTVRDLSGEVLAIRQTCAICAVEVNPQSAEAEAGKKRTKYSRDDLWALYDTLA